jgi:hypothetical protein
MALNVSDFESRPAEFAGPEDRDECLRSMGSYISETNTDAAVIDYTAPSFLGIPNPMAFAINITERQVSGIITCRLMIIAYSWY